MADQLEKAFQAVKKYAAGLGEIYVEAQILQPSNYDGTPKPRVFRAYVSSCGFQDGYTIPEMIAALEAERVKRGKPIITKEEREAAEDLPF